jgi:hypothetical protein
VRLIGREIQYFVMLCVKKNLNEEQALLLVSVFNLIMIKDYYFLNF